MKWRVIHNDNGKYLVQFRSWYYLLGYWNTINYTFSTLTEAIKFVDKKKQYGEVVWEDDDYQPDKKELKEVIRQLLKGYGNDDCRLDHHGNCQEHGFDFPCFIPYARELVNEVTDGK